jgi:hypothetical protein
MPYTPVVPSLAGPGGVLPRELLLATRISSTLLLMPVPLDITNLHQQTHISRLLGMTVRG